MNEEAASAVDPNTPYYYALSTIAQCAAALAALIGFLGLWQLDRLREQIARLIGYPKDDPTNTRLPQLQREQQRLLWALRGFLFVTLVIMGCAIVGFLYLDQVRNWGGTPRLLWIAGILLVGGPIVVVWMAARVPRALVTLILLLTLATPALAGPAMRCQTHHEPTLNRLQTLCSDGTRAISTWSSTLQQWQTTVTPPPGKTCTGRLHPRTHQWEGRCR